MTVKELKEKVNKLPSNLDDMPVRVFEGAIKNGSNYLEVVKVFKVGKSKEDINCVGILLENNGEKLEL